MQRKQFLVKLSNEVKGNKFIKYLESNGFKNVHRISFEDLQINVLAIGEDKFFAINTTCLAGLASCNIKPISIEEFMEIYNEEQSYSL